MAERLRRPDPDNPALAPIRDAYAKRSPDGADHWATFHAKVSKMGASGPTMTTADLQRIDRPVLVIVGDDDVVDHRHTIELYENLPVAQLAIVPASSHLLPIEHPEALEQLVRNYIDRPAPERLMPMRTSR